MEAPAELAIVLHTHMPYVEGFGTWPFGEEWLWEAVATSYLPLLDVLDAAAARSPDGRAPVTLSLTPVLCDQLEAPGAIERCVRFLREVRPETHRRDIETFRAQRDTAAVDELERSAAEYAAAAEMLGELGAAGLLERLGGHASWTSSATHAILPLLCLDEAIDLQIEAGVDSHRRRFGSWSGGFWLPECAHATWLHEHLEAAGVRATCVELTNLFGLGDRRHLQPQQTSEGPLLWPVDRATMALVWGEDGYPSCPGYRAYDRMTEYRHRVWSTDGSLYDHARAGELTRRHAREFVDAVGARTAQGGICVCALDTELLGHWWYEGVQWLGAVLGQAVSQGLALSRLDEAAARRHQAARAPCMRAPTSWGDGGDLRTWSAPAVADLAWQARGAELRTLAAASGPPPPRALRELLALQSSDWAFLAYRDWAGDYPRQRARGHAEALDRLLDGDASLAPDLRNLAPFLL
jgi:1,4-alpha-glucan branching enzyme